MNTKTILLIAAVFAVSCGTYYYVIQNKQQSPVLPEPTQQISEPKIATIHEQTAFYDIKAVYPSDSRDKKKEMEQFVLYRVNQKKEEWKIGGEVYTAEQDIAKQFPDRPKMTYELDIQYKKYESKKFGTVSYIFENYEFTGGAHGNTTLAAFTFGKDGRMEIDSILDFENGNDIALTRILEKKLTAVLGEDGVPETISEGLGLAYLKADGKTLDLKKCGCDGFFFPSNFMNFIVADDSMIFVMGQYQVAAYAVGMPEAKISWKELSPFLSSSFKKTFSL